MEEYIYDIYQRLGNFFTGSNRRRLFYEFALLIFVSAAFVSIHWEVVIEANILFWLFSSMAQSLAALIAVLGVVIIFKYQSMLTREERLIEEMNKSTSALSSLGGLTDATSGEELLKNINRHLSDDPSKEEGPNTIKLRRVKKELESIIFIRSFLKDHMLKFSVYILAVILLNFFLLVLVPILTSFTILALGSLYLSLFLAAYAFFLVAKVIASTFP